MEISKKALKSIQRLEELAAFHACLDRGIDSGNVDADLLSPARGRFVKQLEKVRALFGGVNDLNTELGFLDDFFVLSETANLYNEVND